MKNNKSVKTITDDVENVDVTTWALPDGAIARLGRGCHPDFAFSPDGQYLVIGNTIGLWVYDLETLAPIALWESERGMIFHIAISPNGKWIAACNSDEILKVLDLQNGACLAQVKLDNYITNLTFSHDSQYLAVVYGNTPTAEVLQADTCNSVAHFTVDAKEESYDSPICFSPDTRLVAFSCSPSESDDAESIIVWDMESAEQIACLSAHTNWVSTLCFSPCGTFLTSGGEDRKVYVWDVDTWQHVQCYSDYGDVYRIVPSWTPDSNLRAVIVHFDETGPATISVRDLESGEEFYKDQVWGNNVRFSREGDWGNTVEFSNGSQLAYECRHDFINVWTPEYPYKRQITHSPISFPASTHTRDAFPTFAVFSDDGKTLAVKHHHEGVMLWDIESRRSRPAVQVESAGKRQYVYKTIDGQFYVTSLKNDTVTLWEADGNGIPLIEGTGHEYWGASPALSPTGEFFAYADEHGKLKVWDVQSGNQLYEIIHPLEQNDEDDDDTIVDLQFSFDGKILASKSQSTSPMIVLWDVELGEIIETSPNNTATSILGMLVLRHLKPRSREVVHISHDGKYLSSLGNNSYLYDVEHNDYLTRLSLPKGLEHVFNVAEFSVCGKYFAAGTWWQEGMENMVICLWYVESGKQIVTFKGHPTDVHALAFSPDNKLLASASYDGTILLWDLTPYL